MGQANSRQEAFWDACGFGRTHLVKKFIEEGIDINWVSFTHDCCPIHVASQGKPDVVKLLIEAKCDINVQDSRGMTALHHAAMKGEEEIVCMLIEAGCELNTQDKNGWTALHNAAYWAHAGAVQRLITDGASVAMVNKHQRLALHEVARSQCSEEETLGRIARLLISAGSDVDAVSSDFGEGDFTSLMFAAYHGHTGVVKALVEGECDVNACGSINKWTALHWAADRGHLDVVTLLVENGAMIRKKTMRGETAADRAKDGSKVKDFLLNCLNDEKYADNDADDKVSISSSQSFNAKTALDTAVAIEKMAAQAKSRASASAFVPITMPPLSISTSEERKRNIRLGLNRRTSGGSSASGPTSPGWSPGSGPYVELASDGLGDNADPNLQLLRSFQDRLNRRIDQASRTLQGGLLRPENGEATDSSSSSSEASAITPAANATHGTTTTTTTAASSREVTPASQGSESVGASSCESEEGGGGGGENGVSTIDGDISDVGAALESFGVSDAKRSSSQSDESSSSVKAAVIASERAPKENGRPDFDQSNGIDGEEEVVEVSVQSNRVMSDF